MPVLCLVNNSRFTVQFSFLTINGIVSCNVAMIHFRIYEEGKLRQEDCLAPILQEERLVLFYIFNISNPSFN